MEDYPGTKIIISGDFNFVFSPDIDSIGRIKSKQEVKLSEYVEGMMTRFDLIDTYRSIHKWGGFTWGKDNPSYLRSRLDHILISKSMRTSLVQSYTSKTPNESDHFIMYSELEMTDIKFGPGIQRCNSELLNDDEVLRKCQDTLTNELQLIPNHWNPHQTLDFIKMKTREILLAEGRLKMKEKKSALTSTYQTGNRKRNPYK